MGDDLRVAAIMLTLNEEARLGLSMNLPWIAKYADTVLVLDGGSTDSTVQIARKYANQIMVKPTSGDLGGDRNFAQEQVAPEHDWILMVDGDEKFDQTFLEKMRIFPDQFKVDAFKFPRINLPDARDYPDYQVRFYRALNEIIWIGETHETLYRGPAKIDQVSCIPLDLYPIIHLKRRKDIRRPWW